MMVKSMTAYARVENQSGIYEVTAEIRSYNSKNLDIALHLPRTCLPLEERIKTLVAAHIHRGRVELRIEIKALAAEEQAFEIDWPRAEAYRHVLHRLRDALKLDGGVTLELLVGAGGVIKPAENAQDLDALWPVVETALLEALSSLDRMRRREGASLAEDFRRRLDTVADELQRIESASAGLLQIYQARLLERIQILTQGKVEIDPGRIAQEAAFQADRSDISEEIVRVASHLSQFRRIMEDEEPAGRKLNFLLQEFNREFNTMGAKTARTDIAHKVVDLKCELEKMREQVQNIE